MIFLRRTQPDAPRTFKVPFYPLTPLLGIAACLFLMFNLGSNTWIVFGIWMAVGFIVYLGYGRKNSRLGALAKETYRETLKTK